MDNTEAIENQIAKFEEQLHNIPREYTEALNIEDDNKREQELDRINTKQNELRSSLKELKRKQKEENNARSIENEDTELGVADENKTDEMEKVINEPTTKDVNYPCEEVLSIIKSMNIKHN